MDADQSDGGGPSSPWCAGALLALACAGGGAEPVLHLQVLDNGDARAEAPAEPDEAGLLRLAWWRSPRGHEHVQLDEEGGAWLMTAAGERLSQPFACYLPLLDELRVRGRLKGHGRLRVRDEVGGSASLQLAGVGPAGEAFEWRAAEILAAAGGALVPRLVLELEGGEGGAAWAELAVEIALPAPEPAALREEILDELALCFGYWIPRDLDREGPRETGFLAWQHDVLTGERIARMPVTCHPLFLLLGRALACGERPGWRAAYERFLDDYFRYGLHPQTGIPRNYDTQLDQPNDERAPEIAQSLAFLIDLAERGAPERREAARAALRKAGETLLARGVLPDGSVAARYRPSDGEPNTDTPPLRALDVPAQLGRLGALLADERYTRAARNAMRRFEYTHYWAGEWEFLDPGFDDHYGHFGERALTLWRADPSTPSFRRVALGGLEYYRPRWRDAVRLGGYIAADEVRCWPIATGIAALEPGVSEWMLPLLEAAARAHFKSEQFADSSWGDVTYYGFDPKASLEVGDLPAIPQNLLIGLAVLHRVQTGAEQAATRARFTAILRQTRATFRREHGYLSTRGQRAGQNPAGGSIRLASGLVEMLEALR